MRKAGNRNQGVGMKAGARGLLAQLRSWLRTIAHRNRIEAEMDSELAFHLEQLTADLVRSGQSPAEAARNARIALGTALTHKEGMRASLGLRWWDELRTDLRYGLRMLRKSPGFTVIAAGSLALAVGANTAILSVAKALYYDPLSAGYPEQLRLVEWTGDDQVTIHNFWGSFVGAPGTEAVSTSFSTPAYEALRATFQKHGELFAFKDDVMNVTAGGNALRAQVEMVSGNYYNGMEVQPQLGRPIMPNEDAAGRGEVAVIGDALWARAFGRSPAVLGQTIRLNNQVLTIIGVNPRGFTGAQDTQEAPDVVVPLSMQQRLHPLTEDLNPHDDPDLWWIGLMARVKPGENGSSVQAELDAALSDAIRSSMTVRKGETLPRLKLVDGRRGWNYTADYELKKPVIVLISLSGLVLLLCCANIANLMLARGAQRQREMSVRLALGAGRRRILRQMLIESLELAILGAAGGLLLGYLGRNALPRLLSNSWDTSLLVIRFDWRIFGSSLLIALLTGVVFGVLPAWMASRTETGVAMKEASRTATRRRKMGSGKILVTVQIALSTLLVIGAGLALRSASALHSIDVGFRTKDMVLFNLELPRQRYPGDKALELHRQLGPALRSIPGVEGVTSMVIPLLAQGMWNTSFLPEGESAIKGKQIYEDINIVGANFFPTMGIPIVAGRGFGPQDTETSPAVAIINQSLARKRFPGQNPIGKRFRSGNIDNDWGQIVGICADTRYNELRGESPPVLFFPYEQRPNNVRNMTYALRTGRTLEELTPEIRRVVQGVDRDLPVMLLRTQQQQIDATMHIERVMARLTTAFGLLALVLACVGIYGIMAYSVANRKNEIGIRLALGAQQGHVRKMILTEGAWLALVGIAAGGAVALTLARLVSSMLYGIKAYDPVTLASGVALLLAATLAATWIPARRAAGVQPMEALRHE